jgi:hypothetical protein
MKIKIDPLKENALSLMRRAGYTFQKNEGGEQAWIRVFGSSGYPRFHIYSKQEKTSLLIHIHLDHKKHTYGEDTRHHADYGDSAPLQEEVHRLLTSFGESATIVE